MSDEHIHDDGKCCECGEDHCCCECPVFLTPCDVKGCTGDHSQIAGPEWGALEGCIVHQIVDPALYDFLSQVERPEEMTQPEIEALLKACRSVVNLRDEILPTDDSATWREPLFGAIDALRPYLGQERDMNESILKGITQAEAGDLVDRGSFSDHVE